MNFKVATSINIFSKNSNTINTLCGTLHALTNDKSSSVADGNVSASVKKF